MEKVVVKENANTKKIKEYMIALSCMLTIAPLNIFYIAFNNSKRGVRSLVTPLDAAIPFRKEFVIPYVAWYVFIFITIAYLCYKDRRTYYSTVISYNLVLIASYITFFFFQTTVPRPELMGSDIFTKIVTIIYGADQPYNCFPSIHVSTSFLMIRAVMVSSCKSKKNMIAVWFTSIMVIISTLFIKQHVILDVVSGILYADIIFRIVHAKEDEIFRFIKEKVIPIFLKKKFET